MLRAWGSVVVAGRWWVVTAAVLVGALGVTFGAGVFDSLVSGGFNDPGSESTKAAGRITAELGSQSPDLVVLYSSPTATVEQPAFKTAVTKAVAHVEDQPEVARVTTYYETGAPRLVSRDRHATYATVTLGATTDDGKQAEYEELRDELDAPGLTTRVGGLVAFNDTADAITKDDVSRGEMVAMPLVLVALVFLFGGLVAASMPLLVGVLAVLSALTVIKLITSVLDVSTFAVNSVTVLSLGMAIDYSLLIISRFREQLRKGLETADAVEATMSTAGRTVLVSGVTVVLSLASLLVFPEVFLRSMGLGGMAGVMMAMLASLTALPALLAILGPRINTVRLPVPFRARRERGGGAESGAWSRLAVSVMRRPVRYIVVVLGVLVVLALPLAHARFAGADERVLPVGAEPREVAQRIEADFPAATSAPIETVVTGASPAQVGQLARSIEALPHVSGAEAAVTRGATTLVLVDYHGAPSGQQAYDAVTAIRSLPTPPGVTVMVGGRSAADVDKLDDLGDRLPWMAAIMAAVTIVLLLVAFRSLLLPLKAVVMNLLSIAASFGVVTWIFQDGHLSSWLGFTATGSLEPSTPIFVLAVLFGLATDYEVFLLSRVREEWLARKDNAAAVATGLQHTGGIITSAAVLLMIVVAAFATGQVVFAKIIGIGMLIAILVDATLVRALLVPATMRLLGRWNWWTPAWFTRPHRRPPIGEPLPGPAPQAEGRP